MSNVSFALRLFLFRCSISKICCGYSWKVRDSDCYNQRVCYASNVTEKSIAESESTGVISNRTCESSVKIEVISADIEATIEDDFDPRAPTTDLKEQLTAQTEVTDL